jgi:hypothetical protein
VYTSSVNLVSKKTPQSTPMSFIAHKALSNPPLQLLCMLYDATVNNPLPSAREGGSAAVEAMGFSAEKAKEFMTKQGTYALATNPGCWSNSNPRPVWRSVGAVLWLPLEIKEISGYHGWMCYVS